MPTPLILLADDELVIRRAIQGALLDMGFDVRQASDGDEGRALLDEMKDNYPQLLITDIDMPGSGGEDLAEYARQRCGQIKVLFTSGKPRPALLKSIAGDANTRFLEKPFSPSDLAAAIQALGIG
jgi:two-component system, cell cycle sensor histidine kinase and response regulator CckA